MLSFLFFVATYWDDYIIPNIIFFELPILLYLIVDFLLFFYISKNRIFHLVSFQSIIFYLTVIPDLLLLTNVVTDPYTIEYYELPFWKVFRIFGVERLSQMFIRKNMAVQRIYFKLAYTIFIILIMFSCCELVIENRFLIRPCFVALQEALALDPEATDLPICQERYRFHDMLYYVCVTLTTTGYGDISPKTVYGQTFFVFIFLMSLVVIAQQFQELQKIN